MLTFIAERPLLSIAICSGAASLAAVIALLIDRRNQ